MANFAPMPDDQIEVARLFKPWAEVQVLPSKPGADDRVDLVLSLRGDRPTLCEVRRLTSANLSSYALESALAHAALWGSKSQQRQPLILIVGSLTQRLIRSVENALDITKQARLRLDAFAVLSRRGGAVIRMRKWGLNVSQPDSVEGFQEPRHLQNGFAGGSLQFSEVNSQLLKELLYQELRVAGAPVDQWWDRHPEPFVSPEQWADRCEVGRATAYRLQRILRHEGYLGDSKSLRLVNADRLLMKWLEYAAAKPAPAYLPAQPLYEKTSEKMGAQPKTTLSWLHRKIQKAAKEQGGAVAVNGWMAIQERGLDVVAGNHPVTVVVPRPQDLRSLIAHSDLRDCPPGEAWAFFTVARGRRSVFASVADRNGTVPAVDLWQAALDVASDPNRGYEQAEAIAKRLIKSLA